MSYGHRDSRITECRCEIQGSQKSRGPQVLTGTSFLVFSWQSLRCQEDSVCQGPSSQRETQRALLPGPDLTKSWGPGNCSPDPVATSDALVNHEFRFLLTEAGVEPKDPLQWPTTPCRGTG